METIVNRQSFGLREAPSGQVVGMPAHWNAPAQPPAQPPADDNSVAEFASRIQQSKQPTAWGFAGQSKQKGPKK
jgi:hypothetical protein